MADDSLILVFLKPAFESERKFEIKSNSFRLGDLLTAGIEQGSYCDSLLQIAHCSQVYMVSAETSKRFKSLTTLLG